MPRDPRILLSDIAEAVDKIAGYTDEFDPSTLDDPRTLDAVIRNLEVIGEAARNVPDEERRGMPDVEWRKNAGFRDVLIHQYFASIRSSLPMLWPPSSPACARRFTRASGMRSCRCA